LLLLYYKTAFVGSIEENAAMFHILLTLIKQFFSTSRFALMRKWRRRSFLLKNSFYSSSL